MAEETVIFERMIIQQDQNDTVFVRLSAEDDVGLTEVTPTSLIVTEAFSYGSPIVALTFVDGAGVYNNLMKLSPSTTYWLTMSDGDLINNIQRVPLNISKLECKNKVAGKSEQVAFKITFIHQGWNSLINRRYNRGWSHKPYNEVVEEIMADGGYDSVETTPSRGLPECIIQPHWTNNIFLKWIQERAVSKLYDDHFEFGGKIDNTFFFKSVSDIIDEHKEKALNGEIPLIKLMGHRIDDNERTQDKSENYDTPTNFLSYNATEYYVDSVVNGAGGVNAMFYDYQSGSFVQSAVTASNTNTIQLSDWGAIKKVHESTNLKMFGGRDVDTLNEAAVKVSSVALSTNQFAISIDAALQTHIGDMVEIIMPSPTNMIPPFSVMYSGFYLVASLTHIVALEPTSSIITKLELARQGFDGKELEGYVKSRGGKFIQDREEYEGRVYVQS